MDLSRKTLHFNMILIPGFCTLNVRSSQPPKSRFGLKDQSKDISTVEIVAVFTILLHFTKNMNIIPKVLEEKSVECLQQIKTRKCSLNQLKHDKVSHV